MNKDKSAHVIKSSFSVRKALRAGWESVKQYPGILIGATVISLVISLIFPVLTSILGEKQQLASALINVASILVQAGITLGLIQLALHALRDEKPAIGDLFSVFDLRLLKHIGAAILYGLMVLIGTILFIVPGVYAALTFMLFPYAIVEHNSGPIDALRYSKRITTGSRWRILLFIIVSGLVNLLGILVLGVGFLVSAPVVSVATAAVYEALRQGKDGEQMTSSSDTANEKAESAE